MHILLSATIIRSHFELMNLTKTTMNTLLNIIGPIHLMVMVSSLWLTTLLNLKVSLLYFLIIMTLTSSYIILFQENSYWILSFDKWHIYDVVFKEASFIWDWNLKQWIPCCLYMYQKKHLSWEVYSDIWVFLFVRIALWGDNKSQVKNSSFLFAIRNKWRNILSFHFICNMVVHRCINLSYIPFWFILLIS